MAATSLATGHRCGVAVSRRGLKPETTMAWRRGVAPGPETATMTNKALQWAGLALAATTLCVSAQTAPPAAAAPPPSGVEKMLADVKHPVSWLTWGGDLRIRNEYMNNLVTLGNAYAGHEQDVIRFRGRVWASGTVTEGLTLNGRFSAEPREWMKPAFVGAYRNQSGMEWRYGIADNLNVKWDKVLDQPLTITAGRQDIMLGDFYDWWLVADGTPGDGSWTFFLDSVRVAYDAKDIKTKFDVIYIYQNPEPDAWVPTLGHSKDYPITDQREQGVVVYASNKSIKNTQIDGYFIWKHDDRETFTIANADRTPGDNADIYTVGGKITGTPAAHLQYSIEGAYQFGKKEDTISYGVSTGFLERDIAAYGGKAKLTYLFKDKLNNQVNIQGEFLSGDDPNSDKDEMFDLLWGRWPRWSELYIYSYIMETSGRVAQINNIGRIGAGWSISPMKDMTFSAVYNAMFAPEKVPTRNLAASRFSGDGNFRGHYLQTVFKKQFGKHVAAHLWGEWVFMGNYYTSSDVMSFLRAEIMFSL
jgi:hypothetical protein